MTPEELDAMEKRMMAVGYSGFPVHDALRAAWAERDRYKAVVEDLAVVPDWYPHSSLRMKARTALGLLGPGAERLI